MLAWVLVILGVVFLLKNLGLLAMVNWDIIWPIVLIVLGAIMLLGKKKSW